MQKETETTRGNHQIYVQICTKMYVSRPFLYSNQKLYRFLHTQYLLSNRSQKWISTKRMAKTDQLSIQPSWRQRWEPSRDLKIWLLNFKFTKHHSVVMLSCWLLYFQDFLWKLGHPSWFWQAKKVSLFHSCSSGSTIPPTSCKAIRKTIRSCPGATNTTWQELKRKISRFRT